MTGYLSVVIYLVMIVAFAVVSLGVARVRTGVAYSGFNSLAEYEQDLTALGFPDLLPAMTAAIIAGDFQELHRQCLDFDEHLRDFLSERSAPLNTFDRLEDLQSYLQER